MSGAESLATYCRDVALEPVEGTLEVIRRRKGLKQQLARNGRHRKAPVRRQSSEFRKLILIEADLERLGAAVSTCHLHARRQRRLLVGLAGLCRDALGVEEFFQLAHHRSLSR
ncbi:hypothetical protein BH24ACT12_BH24ACT12_10140 [soil metagenome]